jgi:hypothetical protein
MAKRRRQHEHEPAAVEVAAEPIRPEERLDPRVILLAPEDVQRDPEALLRWAATAHPTAVKSETEVLADRDARAARRALALARRDARRRGLPEPDPADYLPGGFNPAS